MISSIYYFYCTFDDVLGYFELWNWRIFLRVLWTARKSNQSIPKEISPEYLLEGLVLKLKLPILWPLDAKSRLIGKDPDAGKDWRQQEKGMTEDEMVGWHHRLSGHEFEQAPGDGKDREAWCAAVHGVTKSQTWREWLNNNKAIKSEHEIINMCLYGSG